MSIEINAWVSLGGGNDVAMKVTVPEDATEDQIDEAVKKAALNIIDWGWEDPFEEPYELYSDTYSCGCCTCCGCSCEGEYGDDEDWEDE